MTNASYGFEKIDHSYLFGVEDRDGLLVPAECECKADQYNEDYDYKHKVALATVGGPVVIEAAVDFSVLTTDSEQSTTVMGTEKLQVDGGAISWNSTTDSNPLNVANHSDCDCDDLPGGFPC